MSDWIDKVSEAARYARNIEDMVLEIGIELKLEPLGVNVSVGTFTGKNIQVLVSYLSIEKGELNILKEMIKQCLKEILDRENYKRISDD